VLKLAIFAPKSAKKSDSAPRARIGTKPRVCERKRSSIERPAPFATIWESLNGDSAPTTRVTPRRSCPRPHEAPRPRNLGTEVQKPVRSAVTSIGS
jgi:hypothetical protein